MGISVAFLCLAAACLMLYLRGFSSLWVFSASVSAFALLLLAIFISMPIWSSVAREAYAVALLRSCDAQKAKRPTKKNAAIEHGTE